MSRTAKYLIAIILILAGAMWVMSIYKSCKTNTTEDTENVDNNNSSTDENKEDIESLYVDDEEAGTGEEENPTDTNNSDQENEAAEEKSTDTSEKEEEEKGTVEEFDLNGNGGEFLVIAGAFISESNAKSLQRDLRKKGLQSAVKVFLGSSYHTVVLGSYRTQSAAWDVAEKIGDEAYVHKRRYPKRMRKNR